MYVAYGQSQRGSNDFQWSPTVLLKEGINPYEYYLKNKYTGRIILSQAPNYFHGLYILYYPFAFLDWKTAKIVWFILNISFVFVSFILLTRQARLNAGCSLCILFVFLASTPLRMVLAQGQQSLLILVCFSILFCSLNKSKYLIYGIEYFKYSFAPSFFVYLLYEKNIRWSFLSILPVILGFCLFYLAQDSGSILSVLVQPLEVNNLSINLGAYDLMSVIQSSLFIDRNDPIFIFSYYIFPFFFSSIFVIYAAKNIKNTLQQFSIISLVSLVTFKHQHYDSIFYYRRQYIWCKIKSISLFK